MFSVQQKTSGINPNTDSPAHGQHAGSAGLDDGHM